MTCGIYMIQNKVDGKIYIGQSVDIKSRWGKHKGELRRNRHKNDHLQRSWNKYGEDKFEFTIICECDESQLNTMEIDYISKLRTYDPDYGYNKTYGGEGGRLTEEAIEKMREALKGENNPFYGKHHSEESRRKNSEAHKGKTHSEESRQKMSESRTGEKHPLYGKPRSEETKEKISKANKGKLKGENNPNYGKRGIRCPYSIPVVQLTDDGELVEVYGSSKEAMRNGFDDRGIAKCAKGKQKTYRGYKWMYLHDYIYNIHPNIKTVNLFGKRCKVTQKETNHKISEYIGKGKPIPVVQLTLDGELVKAYTSVMEAARNGFNHSHIIQCSKGRQKTHKGYKWMYLSDYESMKKEGLEK